MLEFTATTNYGVKYTYTAHQVAQDYAATAIQFEDNTDSESELYWKIIGDEGWLTQWWGDYIKGDIELLHTTAKIEIVDQSEYDHFFSYYMVNFGEVM